MLLAVDIIIACHRFPSEEINGKVSQDRGRQGRGRRKWRSVGDTGYRTETCLNKWEYISGGISQGPVRCFLSVFNTFFFVSCQALGFYNARPVLLTTLLLVKRGTTVWFI